MIQRNGTEAGVSFSEELQFPTIVERVVWLQNIFIFHLHKRALRKKHRTYCLSDHYGVIFSVSSVVCGSRACCWLLAGVYRRQLCAQWGSVGQHWLMGILYADPQHCL